MPLARITLKRHGPTLLDLARRLRFGLLFVAFFGTGVVLLTGCRESSSSGGPAAPSFETDPQQNQKLFDYAIELLNNLEQYNEFNNDAALTQIISRLNEWATNVAPQVDWRRDPLIDSLDEAYQRLPVVITLDEAKFQPFDGSMLRSAIWMRNISGAARGEQIDDLSRATALFDWTVRNIQLEPYRGDEAEAPAILPWHALLLGKGSALDRAWIFALLARQQHLDVAIIAYRNPSPPHELIPWTAGLLSRGEIYLFDPRLGLPIPGPDGQGVATLSQVRAGPALLDQLDVDEEHPYPVKGENLSEVVALIETSPEYLARRMKVIESRLAGERSVVLSVDASALAERFAAAKGVDDVELWTLPYERIRRMMTAEPDVVQSHLAQFVPFRIGDAALWRGRVLHLFGHYSGESNANEFYQAARPAEEDIASAQLSDEQERVVNVAKQDASYWLGLVAFERGQYDAAIRHLENRTLEASPGGPWTSGARYNLARAYEAQGELEKAIEIYESDDSPQSHGNRLRARRLREKQAAAAPAS